VPNTGAPEPVQNREFGQWRLSQSSPTPTTTELLPVITIEAVGAPGFAFPVPTAPTAPEVFTPLKLITVREESTFCERVAVTVTALRVEDANADQISAVPFCALVLLTRLQERPPPATFVTVAFVDPVLSAGMNASSSSLGEDVEKAGVATVVLVEP